MLTLQKEKRKKKKQTNQHFETTYGERSYVLWILVFCKESENSKVVISKADEKPIIWIFPKLYCLLFFKHSLFSKLLSLLHTGCEDVMYNHLLQSFRTHFTSIYFHKNLREVFHCNFFYAFLNVQYFSEVLFSQITATGLEQSSQF